MYTILHYLDVKGNDPFQDWLNGLRDRNAKKWLSSGAWHVWRSGWQEIASLFAGGFKNFGLTSVLVIACISPMWARQLSF